ncbi:HK-domain-containing protein, partial [Auriscalpium vulgare]
EMLEVLEGTGVKSVAIGVIKSTNVLRVLHGTQTPSGHALDGVAVVSDIVASTEPFGAAQRLSTTIRAWAALPRGRTSFSPSSAYTSGKVIEAAAALVATVRRTKPLAHQITNNVVKTQSANVTLALGASPIMAEGAVEQAELAHARGGLLVNFGTLGDLPGMLEAGAHANLRGKPVVFDPVGVGATAFRRKTAGGEADHMYRLGMLKLLDRWQPTVIKGNAAEIGALAQLDEMQAQGVDSIGGFNDAAGVMRALAQRERCIVALSGPVDYISDGATVLRLANGHALLAEIIGSGCILGTAVATFCGAASIAAARGQQSSMVRPVKLWCIS